MEGYTVREPQNTCGCSEMEASRDNYSEGVQRRGLSETSGLAPREEHRGIHSPGRSLTAKPATQSSGQQPLDLTRARRKGTDRQTPGARERISLLLYTVKYQLKIIFMSFFLLCTVSLFQEQVSVSPENTVIAKEEEGGRDTVDPVLSKIPYQLLTPTL